MEPQVAIVTDTTACVPADYVARYGIEVVPIQLIIDGRTYRDGIDISAGEFYAMLRQSKKLPTTSSSSPQHYLDAFRRAGRRAKRIFCLTEPSRFSAMYNSARIAAELARGELGDTVIEVVECTTAAAGQGLVAIAAARAAMAGADLAGVREVASRVMAKVNLFAALDSLHYLARSGRVPQAAAMVNSLLDIKPIFTLNHTEARTVALPRTMKSAANRILKLMVSSARKGKALHVAVMHADAPDEANRFKDRVISQFDCREVFITEFTPVMGVHTGPGLIGVAFYAED
ncbi:MAG: DegV family protein [Dehalococcoidales bacterium]|nr:DegV family protein [Dehalococcoidales bacterium]